MKKLTKRNYLGEGYIHVFSDKNGNIKNVPCTKEEYDTLAVPNAVNPVLDGYTWVKSYMGTVKVDTPDSTLGMDEYCDYHGNYVVSTTDSNGEYFFDVLPKTSVVNDKLDQSKLNKK